MTEDERKDIEVYLKILDYSHKRHDWRANIEWKVTFAVWTVLSAASAFFITQKIIISLEAGLALVCPFLVFHIFWLYGIYSGHTKWKSRMDFWADKAQSTALGHNHEFMKVRMIDPASPHSSHFFGQGAAVYALVTILMAAAFVLIPYFITGNTADVLLSTKTQPHEINPPNE